MENQSSVADAASPRADAADSDRALTGSPPQSTQAYAPSTVSTTGALQSMHFSRASRTCRG